MFEQVSKCQDNKRVMVDVNDNDDDKVALRELQNIDNVFCYANSVIQCIFQCTCLQMQIFKLPKTHALKILFNNHR